MKFTASCSLRRLSYFAYGLLFGALVVGIAQEDLRLLVTLPAALILRRALGHIEPLGLVLQEIEPDPFSSAGVRSKTFSENAWSIVLPGATQACSGSVRTRARLGRALCLEITVPVAGRAKVNTRQSSVRHFLVMRDSLGEAQWRQLRRCLRLQAYLAGDAALRST